MKTYIDIVCRFEVVALQLLQIGRRSLMYCMSVMYNYSPFFPLMCISLNLHEPSIPYPMTFTLTTPLLISREHSGGKAFHLLNKVEGCHNTGA